MRSPLLPIFLIVLVDVLGLTFVFPMLPAYAEHFGATARLVGLVMATYAMFQLVAGPVLGALSDRHGRRPVLLLSQCGTLIGFILLARAQALWMVLLARAIDGATAGNLSTAQAYITDVTAPKDRAKGFAVIGIAFGIGFTVGPAISGKLGDIHLTYPVWMAAALSATSILATYFLLPEPPRDPARGPVVRGSLFDGAAVMETLRRPRLGHVMRQFFLYTLSFSMFTGGFALFAERHVVNRAGHAYGPGDIGLVFTFSGVLGIVLQGGVGRVVKRFGERAFAAVSLGLLGVGFFALGFAHTTRGVLFAATFTALGNAGVRPSLTSLLTQLAGREEQGRVLGVNQSLTSLAQGCGPLLAGWLIDRGWLQGWATLAAVPALLAMLGMIALRSEPEATA